MASTGIQAFLDLLADFGVKQIFGNPGTTELPLNDALVTDRRIKYILGLQEVPVMAMVYNAYREGTPLLVTAGQQDRRLKFEEPILYGDMVGVTKPWTKWSAEV